MLHSLQRAEKKHPSLHCEGCGSGKHGCPFPPYYKSLSCFILAPIASSVSLKMPHCCCFNVNIPGLSAALNTTRPCGVLFVGVGCLNGDAPTWRSDSKCCLLKAYQFALLLSWHTANVTLSTFVPTGKVELHGKVIEVDYSVPKKLR